MDHKYKHVTAIVGGKIVQFLRLFYLLFLLLGGTITFQSLYPPSQPTPFGDFAIGHQSRANQARPLVHDSPAATGQQDACQPSNPKRSSKPLPLGWCTGGSFYVRAEGPQSTNQAYSFRDLWKEAPDKFQGKCLYLRHEGEYIYSGFILKCYEDKEKYKEAHKIFKLNDAELVVQQLKKGLFGSTEYIFKLTQEKKSSFLEAIENGLLKQGDEFELERAKDSTLPLPSGHYKVDTLGVQSVSWFSSPLKREYFGGGIRPLAISLVDTVAKERYQLLLDYGKDTYGIKSRCNIQFSCLSRDKVQNYEPAYIHFWESDYQIITKATTKLQVAKAKGEDILGFVTPGKKEAIEQYRKTIENYKEHIVNKLVAHETLLYQLCDQLIDKGTLSLQYLKTIEPALFLSPLLNEIMEIYVKKLGIYQITMPQLLEELTQEALLFILAQRQGLSKVKTLMGLLRASFCHTEKMKAHPIILLVGNTGSGKSTTANLLIGAKLQIVRDKTGRAKGIKVVDDTKGPAIGMNSACSQTLYAQAFQVKDRYSMPVIVDCPGFEDSRDRDYRACAEISIDQAVMQAKSVKSIVQVIPTPDGCRHLFEDKGRHILKLMETLETRFPTLFDINSPDAALLHILLTKNNEKSDEILQDFKEKIKELINHLQKSLMIEGSGYRKTQHYLRIARCLEKLADEGRAYCLDLSEDQDAQREKLLKAYTRRRHAYSKKEYRSALESIKLHDVMSGLNVTIDTWLTLFTKYYATLPQQIKVQKATIAQKINAMEERFNSRMNTIKAERKALEERKHVLTSVLNPLHYPNSTQQSQKEKEAFLAQAREAFAKTQVTYLQALLTEQSCAEMEQAKSSRYLKEIFPQIAEEVEKEIKALKQQQKELKKEMNKLADGTYRDTLKKIRYNPERMLSIRTLKRGIRDELHAEFREAGEGDYASNFREKVKAKDYDGTLVEDIIIERDYQLMERNENTGKLKHLTDYQEGRYNAIVKGKNYEIDYEPHFRADETGHGSKVMYGFTLYFGRDELPQVDIIYEVPNHQYNEGKITGKMSEVGKIACEIKAQEASLEKAKQELENHKGTIEAHDAKMADIERRIKEEKEKKITLLAEAEVKKALQKVQQLLDDNAIRRQQEEAEKSRQQAEIAKLEKEQEALKRLKRRYAFIIQRNKHYPNFLRQLAASLINDRTSSISDRKATQEDAKQTKNALKVFDRYCYKNYKDILQTCEKDCPAVTPLQAHE